MFRYAASTALVVVLGGLISTGTANPPNPDKQAYLAEIAALTAGSGRWVTDNSAYKSEQEPYDAYGTEWRASFDGTTLSGRLFGLVDGKEVETFWEFRHYWHPERQQAVVEQFGWGGTVGLGTATYSDDRARTHQIFYYANGSQRAVGHVSTFPDAMTHITESFTIRDDAWLPDRRYVWRLQDPR